jgi:NAD(P)-dependent dehydrogenase (short-subunit alcohol dehydrogenase family)
MSSAEKQVAVVVGATSKWQSDGRNTKLAHGKAIDDSDIPVGIRWGVGGAIAQKFAKEGFFVVLTTRRAANAAALEKAIIEQGGRTVIVELDLVSRESISRAFATIRQQVGDPSRPPSTSPAGGRSWSHRRCCRRCASAAPARS